MKTFEKNEVFESYKIGDMPIYHQLYKATSETDIDGIGAFNKTMSDYQRKGWPYVVTVNRDKTVPQYRMYIKGYEHKPCSACKKPREFDTAGFIDTCKHCGEGL